MVCKTLNQDVMHMFYGNNTFAFNLDFRAPDTQQHAGGAAFYRFGGLEQAMTVSPRIASCIRRCEATFMGLISAATLPGSKQLEGEEEAKLRKWLAGFGGAFKDEHRPQIMLVMEQMVDACWTTMWDGPVAGYVVPQQERHARDAGKEFRRRFRAFLSRTCRLR